MAPEDSSTGAGTAFCTNCGSKVSATDKWCSECGEKQPVGDEREPVATAASTTKPESVEDSEAGSSFVSKYGSYFAWGGAVFMFMLALGSFIDGSTAGVVAGVVAAGIALFFLPPVRRGLGIGNLPGIEPEHSSRRNVLTGVGYGLVSFFAVGSMLPESETAPAGSGSGGGGGVDGGAAVSNPTDEPVSDAERKRQNAEYVSENGDLIVTEYSAVNDGSSRTVGVEGVVENISDSNYEYVQISVGFYDDTGAKVGDGLDNTGGLDAHGRWRFEATGFVDTEDVSSFRFEDLTGW